MCKGIGIIPDPGLKQKVMDGKKIFAKALRDKGYSIREIMKYMNYKSPRSVQKLIDN